MKDTIYLENNILKAGKNCELCAHVSTCKFYAKAKALFNSNEFYEMNKYLEWNNSLEAWCENSSCQFYTPFLFDKKLFLAETRKDKSFINAYSWFNLVKVYFNEKHYHKYEEYFQKELEITKANSWAKDKTDEQLLPHCYNLSHGKHIYTFSGKDKQWEEKIELIEVLEYFKAFEEI